ncbi:hypothetical protein [Sphingobacterium tabacisoli]|uniref:DUF4105 domain-containing protein n=1 Tax=Sphingobacterium tabacisoli TaxID=2044855 RepID=A0ABW5L231_9SPHI|nr:hypothetical protein [Sphingobacterium tabacisoli]
MRTNKTIRFIPAWLILLLLLIQASCKNDDIVPKLEMQTNHSIGITELQKIYLKKNIKEKTKEDFKEGSSINYEPDWSSVKQEIIDDSTTYFLVRVKPVVDDGKERREVTTINSIPFLLFSNTDRVFIGKFLVIDSNIESQFLKNGTLKLKDLITNHTSLFVYKDGTVLSDKNNQANRISKLTSTSRSQSCITIVTCDWYTDCQGTLYLATSPYGTCNVPASSSPCDYSAAWSQRASIIDIVCNDDPTPPGGDNGGGSGTGTWTPSSEWAADVSLNLLEEAPGDIITDIKSYLSVFNRNQGIYLTIYVEQPKYNSRDTWSGFPTDPNVGHTWVALNQGNVTRVVGFYPSSSVNPFTKNTSPSVLVDDSGHAASVSFSFNVPATNTVNVLNTISSYNTLYNLDSYNCTTFAIDVAKAGGLNLPSTSGRWPGGGGFNPGDLGQDLRTFRPPSRGHSFRTPRSGSTFVSTSNSN